MTAVITNLNSPDLTSNIPSTFQYTKHTHTHTHTVVTLTYTIPSRPSARRPIPEETVVYTCEVEGPTLTWSNMLFQNDLILITNHVVGETQEDDDTGWQQDSKPRDLGDRGTVVDLCSTNV